MPYSRGIPSLLEVHAEIDHVDQDLYMSLRLHVPAHYTKTHIGSSIPCHKGRNDGMERPLSRGIAIEVPFFQAEQFSPVLQYKSKFIWGHPAAHATEIALDQ